MPDAPAEAEAWRRWTVACGIGAVAAYAALFAVPEEAGAGLALGVAGAFAVLLAIASASLAAWLRATAAPPPPPAALLAAVLNAGAATLFVAMVSVQLAVRGVPGEMAGERVQLGLDVAWDVLLSAGTALFALALLRHPRFGLGFAIPGFAVAALLLALNLATFPEPPASSGLFDAGPLVGAWYLAIAVRLAMVRRPG